MSIFELLIRPLRLQQPSTEAEALKELTALAIIMGEPNDDAVAYTKTGSLQVRVTGSHP